MVNLSLTREEMVFVYRELMLGQEQFEEEITYRLDDIDDPGAASDLARGRDRLSAIMHRMEELEPRLTGSMREWNDFPRVEW
jgi:hypothetical protein